jgi:glyoxylase-like metal-dependent hydrolase (beta-lactamase superfamily II)
MPKWNRLCAWSLLVLLLPAHSRGEASPSAGLESYAKARAVLDAGLAAIGGTEALRAVGVVRRQLTGDWFGTGQGRSPEAFSGPTLTPPAAVAHSEVTSFVDYPGGSWLDVDQRDAGTSDAVTVVTVVGADRGFESVTYQQEKPFYQPYAADDLPGLVVGRLRRYPEGALLRALDRPETLQWVGDASEQGRSQRVISFADSQGARVLLYFDAATGLLTKSETLRSQAVAGDSSAEILYDDYRAVDGLKLPLHYVDRVAGVPTQEWRASSIELHATMPAERFSPPPVFARVVDDPPEPAVQKLGDGLYLIRAPYNSMFAVFRDYVVAFEAPVSGGYAAAGLALIRATVPDKRIRYVVSTHFHFDHVAGVRAYVAEDIPILTTPDAQAVIERIASARHTMHPDTLSRSPKVPRIEAVRGKRVIDDGTNRVELYDIGPTDHVTHILAAYFPRAKVLFEADLWDIGSTEQVIAGADTVSLAKKIRELGLEVERIVPVHGAPGTIQMLDQALAVRAKYFP